MKPFLDDDFLLHSDVARQLYHEHAAPQPIFDYHSHLPPADIANNRTFKNLFEAWLEGDHYKWRAMRWNGIPERLITGDASPREKFQAFARTVPQTLRNPLYHWTHLELKRYFGINELLNEDTAESIWNRANEQLKSLPVRELLNRSRVVVSCTTDDPADTLADHTRIREDKALHASVYPTFRPDKALTVDQPAVFKPWVDRLAAASGMACDSFAGFLAALKQRHDFFHDFGCRLSDHGLSCCEAGDYTEAEVQAIYHAAQKGAAATPQQAAVFRSFMMVYFGRLDAERGWTKQLHLGAQRNNNSRAFRGMGPDTGFDSIGDWRHAESLAKYMDRLDRDGKLPKMVLYNLNPADNYVFASMAGNFQDGSVPGKIQFGSGWWFLDQKEGMTWQIQALSNLGLMSRFVGMLTDSRSFLSFPRHEYFRRILCDLVGRDVVNGELPNDMNLLGKLIRDVCFSNASRFFGLAHREVGEPVTHVTAKAPARCLAS